MIDLPENDVDVVEKMLEFLYHGFYSDGSNQDIRAAPTNAPEPTSSTLLVSPKRKVTKGLIVDEATATSPPSADFPKSAAALLINAQRNQFFTSEIRDVS